MQLEQYLNENEVIGNNEKNVQAPMLANWGCIMFVITSIPLTKLAEVDILFYPIIQNLMSFF